MTIRRILPFLSAASMLLIAACTTMAEHGHLKEDDSFSQLNPGVTTKDGALKLLGSPSSESTFGPTTWYYITTTKENHSLTASKIADQHVTEVAFDSAGLVTSVKRYSKADGKDIQIASRTTPSEGQTLGFFEQILANLGRFNKDKQGSGVTNSHGGPAPPVMGQGR